MDIMLFCKFLVANTPIPTCVPPFIIALVLIFVHPVLINCTSIVSVEARFPLLEDLGWLVFIFTGWVLKLANLECNKKINRKKSVWQIVANTEFFHDSSPHKRRGEKNENQVSMVLQAYPCLHSIFQMTKTKQMYFSHFSDYFLTKLKRNQIFRPIDLKFNLSLVYMYFWLLNLLIDCSQVWCKPRM